MTMPFVTIPVPCQDKVQPKCFGRDARGRVLKQVEANGVIKSKSRGSHNIRLSLPEEHLLDKAAGLLGITRTEILRQSALSVAKAIINGRASSHPHIGDGTEGYQRREPV